MNLPGLVEWMDRHLGRVAFRLETLQVYEVASDGSDYRRYLDGAPTWTSDRKQPWLDRLARERVAGIYRHRVRIVTHPVTPYTRYEAEWGYAPNVAAGEDVRILDLGERPMPDIGPAGLRDWWLLQGHDGVWRGVHMTYADDGRFVSAEEVGPRETELLLAAKESLWAAASPFADWWGRHPELHRDGLAPATPPGG